MNQDCRGMDPISMMNLLWMEQQEYENYWVRNSWGFGDRMRDYLLEGPRRIKYRYEKRP